MSQTLDIAEYLFEHRARRLPAKSLADILDRLIWIVDDNGGQICATIERWLRSDDRDRIEVALLCDETFPFNDAREMDSQLDRISAKWPELESVCRAKVESRRAQNPSEYE